MPNTCMGPHRSYANYDYPNLPSDNAFLRCMAITTSRVVLNPTRWCAGCIISRTSLASKASVLAIGQLFASWAGQVWRRCDWAFKRPKISLSRYLRSCVANALTRHGAVMSETGFWQSRQDRDFQNHNRFFEPGIETFRIIIPFSRLGSRLWKSQSLFETGIKTFILPIPFSRLGSRLSKCQSLFRDWDRDW